MTFSSPIRPLSPTRIFTCLLCIIAASLLQTTPGCCLDAPLLDQQLSALKYDSIERNSDLASREIWKTALTHPQATTKRLETTLKKSKDIQQRKLIGSLLLRLYVQDKKGIFAKPSNQAIKAAVQNLLNDDIPANASRICDALHYRYSFGFSVSHKSSDEKQRLAIRDAATREMLRLMEEPEERISIYLPFTLTAHAFRTQEKHLKQIEKVMPKMVRILIANMDGDEEASNGTLAMRRLEELASIKNPVALAALTEVLDSKDYQQRQMAAYALSNAYGGHGYYNTAWEFFLYSYRRVGKSKILNVLKSKKDDEIPTRLIEVLLEGQNSDDFNQYGNGISLGNATNGFFILLALKKKRPIAALQKMVIGNNSQGAWRASKILEFYAKYPVDEKKTEAKK